MSIDASGRFTDGLHEYCLAHALEISRTGRPIHITVDDQEAYPGLETSCQTCDEEKAAREKAIVSLGSVPAESKPADIDEPNPEAIEDRTTPRPWKAKSSRGPMTCVTSASPKGLEDINGATGEANTDHYGGNLVAETVTPANAALIVRAVNAHDDLLAAAKAALDEDPCHFDHHGNCQAHRLMDPCEQKLLRDAIAKAEEKTDG